MIKAFLFDFGQTLVDSSAGFRMAEKEAKETIFSEMRSELGGLPWNEFLFQYRKIRKEFHRTSHFSRSDIWQAVYQYFDLKPDLNSLEDWESRYWEQVKTSTKPFPETLEVLKTLSQDYALGLVTNTQGQKSSGTHRLALFPQLEKFFAAIIVAGEAGIPPKPHKQPFQYCLEKLNVSPHEAVFVGDDWRIDIRGAEEMGMKPVWLKHHSVKRNWLEVQTSVPIIKSLTDLLRIFELS